VAAWVSAPSAVARRDAFRTLVRGFAPQ
jgi:hypothetical protein